MKITFFSNFLNHHQTPFCDELYNSLGSDFTFVSTERVPDSFLQNGYPDCTNYCYNLNSYIDEEHTQKALQLGAESDIVIIGAAPNVFIKKRLRQNKLTFRIAERFLKKGNLYLFHPRTLYHLLNLHTKYRRKNIYMLCASAFTANDLSLVFAYPNKKFKWGYFTQVDPLNIQQIILQKPTERIEILWTARFIEWKHPDLAVRLASELKKGGYNFHLNMIGSGELVESIKLLIHQLDVSDCVSILGSVPNSEVKCYMMRSNVFIFTSDQNEGWGAVLNEAMACGCAVVASNLIGSVPYLIEHKKNGLMFNSGSLSSLLQQTKNLISDQDLCNELGVNAYQTLANEWSPKKASSNFLLLAKSILDEQPILINKGPCSKANRTSVKYKL